jgi:hypothetical protein
MCINQRGIVMNTNFFQLRYLVLIYLAVAYLVLLTACSGGDINVSADLPNFPPLPPAQTSEDITAHGVITGLGGVTINDVRYSTNAAIVTVNGQPGTLADLRHGQTVTVNGRIDSLGLTGTANSILFDANLIGPVENLDAANNRLIVMGQSVTSDPDTLFSAGIEPATFAGLAVGDVVQISGYADAAGGLRATRIDRDLANAELQLIGRVSGLNTANLLFAINRLTVDYSSSILIDLPGGAPANGMMVKVIGTMSGGRFVVERLVTAPALDGNTGQRIQTAGVITRFNSAADFDINNAAAAADAATAFRNGGSADLALNAEVVIDGDFVSGGRIMANRVTFGRLSGNTATQEYGFSDFTRISVPTVFNVAVTQGPAFSVEVTIDEEAANRVDITQTGSTLNIALSSGNGNIDTLEAFVTMPVLERIDLIGVANATLDGFNQAQMTVNVGGVSHLRGNALMIDDLTASVSGVSLLDFGNIRPIGNANIDVSGVSQATLNMDVGSTMTGSIGTGQGTGVSRLFYYGTNVAVNVSKDPISSIVRLGETRP